MIFFVVVPAPHQRPPDPIRSAALWVFSFGGELFFVGVGLVALSGYAPPFASTIGASEVFREGTVLSIACMGTFFLGAWLAAFGALSVVAEGGK
jgi:hypothetical protein